MTRIGTPRPGNGGARIGAGRPKKVPAPASLPPRPVFTCARTFALWALNAHDSEVSMPQKLKVAVALMAADAKRRPAKPPVPPRGDAGIYRPRTVKPFEVIDGDR
jgi:hypothetical protein